MESPPTHFRRWRLRRPGVCIDRHDRLSGALTAQSVALIVNYYAATAGLDPCNFLGQSLRVGFPTSAADTGADVLRELAVTHTALNV